MGQIFQKQGCRKHWKMNEGKEARQGAKAGKSPTGGALETVGGPHGKEAGVLRPWGWTISGTQLQPEQPWEAGRLLGDKALVKLYTKMIMDPRRPWQSTES